MLNLFIQNSIRLQSDGIEVIFRFKKTIYLRICKSSISTEES